MIATLTPLLTGNPFAALAAAAQRRLAPPLRYVTLPTRYGHALVAIAEGRLAALALGDSAEDLVASLRRRFPCAVEAKGDPLFWDSGLDVLQAIEAVRLPAGLEGSDAGKAFTEAVRAQLIDRPGQPLRRRSQ